MTAIAALAAPSHVSPQGPEPAGHPSAPPFIPLRIFLEDTAAVLRKGWPRRIWVEAAMLAVKPSRHGHSLELADPAPPPAAPAQLRAFISEKVVADLARQLGGNFDPAMLVGMTTLLEIEPSFDPKWHIQARVHRLAGDLSASLHAKMIDRLRQTLRREGLYGRQALLPLPRDVTRVVVIHPAGAAGYGDIARELRLWAGAGILVLATIETPYEGAGAVDALAATLRRAAAPLDGHWPDIVVMVRGGGARSGLLTLDAEPVVRAACLCPVPIVVGAGHAIDRSLLDEVTWRSADTPSKALALIAELILAPARRATSNLAQIRSHAERMLDVAIRDLAHIRERTDVAAQRRIDANAAALAALAARLDGDIAGAIERTHRLDAEAQALFGRTLGAVADSLDQAERRLDQALRAVIDHARRLAGTFDDGLALMTTIRSRAATLVATESRNADEMMRDCLRSVGQRFDAAEADLLRQEQIIAAFTPRHVLSRGYAIVSDAMGRLVTSAAELRPSVRLVITFADGEVATVVDSHNSATSTGAPQ